MFKIWRGVRYSKFENKKQCFQFLLTLVFDPYALCIKLVMSLILLTFFPGLYLYWGTDERYIGPLGLCLYTPLRRRFTQSSEPTLSPNNKE